MNEVLPLRSFLNPAYDGSEGSTMCASAFCRRAACAPHRRVQPGSQGRPLPVSARVAVTWAMWAGQRPPPDTRSARLGPPALAS